MKQYPKIEYSYKKYLGEKIWAFDKLDGSNIRAEWNKNSGWFKFGTRKQMISEKDENFGDAITIFLEKYGYELERVFHEKYKNVQSIVVFGEYFGENSFAGRHNENDIKDIVIFDVNLYKKGFISPIEFIDNFSHLDIPDLIYNGIYNEEFIEKVKNNEFDLKEGVICKGILKRKGNEEIFMTKEKTNDWLNAVKTIYGNRAYFEEFH